MLPVALFALGTAAASADEFVVDGLRYSTLDDNTVTVKKYVEGTDIVIPAKVTDPETSTEYSVVQVERQAFYNTTDVKTVSIPSSVKKNRHLRILEMRRRDCHHSRRARGHRTRRVQGM